MVFVLLELRPRHHTTWKFMMPSFTCALSECIHVTEVRLKMAAAIYGLA
jgi:hypothetical protein